MTRMALCCLLVAPALTASAEILARWEFDSGTLPFTEIKDCETAVRNGILHVEVVGNDVGLEFPTMNTPHPLRIRARMRSGEGAFGRTEIFWQNERHRRYSQDRVAMYPLVHDWQWREYDFPLPTTGGSTVMRFDLGWKPGRFEIDWIQVEEDPLPDGVHPGPAEPVRISDETLQVSLAGGGRGMEILDRRTGRTWQADLTELQAVITGAEVVSNTVMDIALYDHSRRNRYTSRVALESPGRVSFTLDADRRDDFFWALRQWPPSFATDLVHGRLVFCDRSSGVYVPQTDRIYAGKDLDVYGNTQCLDMPWIGVVDPAGGEAMMLLAETPADAHLTLRTDAAGRAWPGFRWRQSLDTFRYPRKASMTFVPSGGYVALAKAYREYAHEQGFLVTLREKARRRPIVSRLPGSPIVWGSRDAWRYTREAETLGIRRGVLSNVQHGLRDKPSVHDLNRLGYLTSAYDSFTDIGEGGHRNIADVVKTAYHARPGLGPKTGWVMDDGTALYDQSSAFAASSQQGYVPDELKDYGFNGRFIDVNMAFSLQEDWHPDHTFDRRQDLENRRAGFAFLHPFGLVLGTEHGNDWGVDLIDYSEGSLGGSFYWEPQGTWNAGRFKQPTHPDDYNARYRRYGADPAYRLPLWQLVYHDCVVSTWYWGDSAGIHYAAAPAISDDKDLFTMLYGGVPLFWRDQVGFRWPSNQDRYARSYHDTCHLHARLAYDRMLDHVFLTADGRVQRTRFSGGTTVVVNFGETAYDYVPEGGRSSATLAPKGFLATAPDLRQSLLLEDGQRVKRIEADEFVHYETSVRKRLGPVEFEGSFTAFRIDDERWQMVLGPETLYRLDVTGLTGGDLTSDGVTLLRLNDVSETVGVWPAEVDAEGRLQWTTDREARFFALVPALPEGTVVVSAPPAVVLPEGALRLSTPSPNRVIRYTTDGSEVSRESPRYGRPLRPGTAMTLRARAFRDDRPAGPETRADIEVWRRLYRSELQRGGDQPVCVNVGVNDLETLRIIVTDGGDNVWADWANLADARFILENGSAVRLEDLSPRKQYQTGEKTREDHRGENDAMLLNGRAFEHGLALLGDSGRDYDVPGGAVRFETWFGIDDRAPLNPEKITGSSELILLGAPQRATP